MKTRMEKTMRYAIKTFPEQEHQAFFEALATLPGDHKKFPIELVFDGVRFQYAPWNVMGAYGLFANLSCAFHFEIPAPLAPVQTVQYFFGPQVNMARKMYAGFIQTPDFGFITEVVPLVLFHRPMGIRMPGDAVNKNFRVSPYVIKGDANPIAIMLASSTNPNVGCSIIESVDEKESFLALNIQNPDMPEITINKGVTL